MLSNTVVEGLSRYAIGHKLRRLRLRKGIGLVELGKHSGLSPAMISKIERDRVFPTLPTLLRLALVFSVGLEHFFTDSGDRPVFELMRKGERQRFPEAPDADDPMFYFESLDFKATDRKLSAYLAHFDVAATAADRAHSHEGIEFLYLVSGRLELTCHEEVHTLETGDSVYFDSRHRHGYRSLGRTGCTALVVTVP